MTLSTNSPLWRPGQTESSIPAEQLGQEYEFRDTTPPSAGSYLTTYNSGRLRRARLVKNTSGGTLTRGAIVKYGTTATDQGKNITAVCSAGDKPAGQVDPDVGSSGVPANYYFLLFYGGPFHRVISDGSGVLAPDDVLVTANSGKVAKQTAAPANTTAAMVQVNSVVGICESSVAATDGLTADARANLMG